MLKGAGGSAGGRDGGGGGGGSRSRAVGEGSWKATLQTKIPGNLPLSISQIENW